MSGDGLKRHHDFLDLVAEKRRSREQREREDRELIRKLMQLTPHPAPVADPPEEN